MVGLRAGHCRHDGQSGSTQPAPGDWAIFQRFRQRSVGDRRQPGAFLFLCKRDYPRRTAASLENTPRAARCSRANRAQQLPLPVADLHDHLLQLRARPVWPSRASLGIGSDHRDLFDTSPCERVLATSLPVWSYGMGLEVSDLRKTTTSASVREFRLIAHFG